MLKKTMASICGMAAAIAVLAGAARLPAGAAELAVAMVPVQKPVPPPRSTVLTDSEISLFERALKAADRRQWSTALKTASQIDSPVPEKIIRWRYYQDDGARIAYGDIIPFVNENPDWPRLVKLLERAEKDLPDDIGNQQAIALFAGQEPITGEGKVRLGEAYIATGETQFGQYWIRDAWIKNTLSSKLEKNILANHGSLLSQDDHAARLDRLLWYGRTSAARRVLPHLSKNDKAIADARLSLMAGASLDSTLSKLPEQLRSHPALIYQQVNRHRRAERNVAAIDALAQVPNSDDIVLRPAKWWTEREIMARRSIKERRYGDAYNIVSRHGFADGSAYAEAEWMAGWLALRFLGEPRVAAEHFDSMYAVVSTPISRARARYWSGRAAEASGQAQSAQTYYAEAAQYSTTFYGQLAGEVLRESGGTLVLPANYERLADERTTFEGKDIIKAVRLLDLAGQKKTLRVFVFHLADSLENEGDYAGLADLMTELGHHELSLRVAKRASLKHIFMPEQSYPITAIDQSAAKPNWPEIAFVFGLSRQESEFNPKALSPAGARGLMQLMPATAKIVARQHKLPFSRDRLLSDADYNVALGAAHLGDLLKRFKGSFILTAVGYNAGPNRARAWIRDYGDPRDANVDPIDWIEKIPFAETRNYVQRVLENMQVYRARIAGSSVPLQLTADIGLTGGHFVPSTVVVERSSQPATRAGSIVGLTKREAPAESANEALERAATQAPAEPEVLQPALKPVSKPISDDVTALPRPKPKPPLTTVSAI